MPSNNPVLATEARTPKKQPQLSEILRIISWKQTISRTYCPRVRTVGATALGHIHPEMFHDAPASLPSWSHGCAVCSAHRCEFRRDLLWRPAYSCPVDTMPPEADVVPGASACSSRTGAPAAVACSSEVKSRAWSAKIATRAVPYRRIDFDLQRCALHVGDGSRERQRGKFGSRC